MFRNQKGFAHFLVLVSIIAVVLTGGWFYTRQKTPKSESPERYYVANIEQCELIEYDCPEGYLGFGDDKGCGCKMMNQLINKTIISNWKTYNDAEYGFLIKYPPDWIAKKIDDGHIQILISKLDNKNIADRITIIPYSSESLKQWVDSGFDDFSENSKFNGYAAESLIRGEYDSRVNDVIIIQSPSLEYYVRIIFDYKFATNKELVEHILATFEFTN